MHIYSGIMDPAFRHSPDCSDWLLIMAALRCAPLAVCNFEFYQLHHMMQH